MPLALQLERAFVRLASSSALLRVARGFDDLLTPEVYFLCGLMLQVEHSLWPLLTSTPPWTFTAALELLDCVVCSRQQTMNNAAACRDILLQLTACLEADAQSAVQAAAC